MTAAVERRLQALERGDGTEAGRPLPVVLPASASDDELAALCRRGIDAYREGDPALLELFI